MLKIQNKIFLLFRSLGIVCNLLFACPPKPRRRRGAWSLRWLLAVFISLSVLVYADSVLAAKLYLDTPAQEVGIGQRMEVVVRLDTEGEIINAVEGTVELPSLVSVENIRDGNSLIAFWAERPHRATDYSITFSGIIPGGWRGNNGELFSFIIETHGEGSKTITISKARTLLHDGEGTETTTKVAPLALRVSVSTPLFDFVEVAEDTEPPEQFIPQIAQDPNIFSGDRFLVFATQDKQSGIDHYEVLETRTYLEDEEMGVWEVAESPYRIKDQRLKNLVYVRAIDRAGNTRVAIFKLPLFDVITEPIFGKPVRPFPAIGIGIVLLLIIFLAYRIIRRAIIKRRINKL